MVRYPDLQCRPNKGMTAEELRRDIDLMTETKAEGIVLFRYQLGTFPDINDIYKR